MKLAVRLVVCQGMTDTLQERLRHGAANIHSIGAGRAADLLREAEIRLGQQAMAENTIAFPVAKEVAAGMAARREFLERAVCHPGPPLSETEDYGPETPLGELEAAVLQRMELELERERELWAIRKQVLGDAFTAKVSLLEAVAQVCVDAGMARLLGQQLDEIVALAGPVEPPDVERDPSWKASDPVDLVRGLVADLGEIRRVCEEALGRTPDPARSTMQVIRDLCAYAEAARTYRANMEDPPADLEAHEQVARPLTPIVRPEHFAGPFPAISGYVKRTAEARAATVDQALRMLKDGQRLAVHDEPERVDILFLDPGQEPPLGQEWTVYGPMTPELRERAAGQAVAADRKAIGALGLEEALEAGRRAVEHMQHPSRLRAEDAVAAFLTPERRPRQEAAREEQDADLVMPLDIMVTVPADSVALPNIGGPAHASIMWSRLPIWSGLATLDLRFESELHDVTELGDRTTRYESESRGIGTIWLALDPKTAARVLEYVGRSVDYPVMLCVVWAGHPVQFGASLAQLADGVSAPEAQHIGAGREWHGYTIAVGKYPDLAARLFHKRNQASAESRED